MLVYIDMGFTFKFSRTPAFCVLPQCIQEGKISCENLGIGKPSNILSFVS